jgi:hypothetical protein
MVSIDEGGHEPSELNPAAPLLGFPGARNDEVDSINRTIRAGLVGMRLRRAT